MTANPVEKACAASTYPILVTKNDREAQAPLGRMNLADSHYCVIAQPSWQVVLSLPGGDLLSMLTRTDSDTDDSTDNSK